MDNRARYLVVEGELSGTGIRDGVNGGISQGIRAWYFDVSMQ